MFRRIYIDNYKCLVNFELPLKELTLLMGVNGVGKTSVLEVVHSLQQLLRGVAKVTDTGIFPFDTLTRWQMRPIQVFEAEVELEGDVLVYRLEVEHDQSTRRARIHHEDLTCGGSPLFMFNMGEVRLFRDDHSEGPAFTTDWSESALARVIPGPDNQRLTRFLDFFRKVVICGLYPASFISESREEDVRLEFDGSNFVSWFRNAYLEHPDLVSQYTRTLEKILFGFSGLRMERVGKDTRALMIDFREAGRIYDLKLEELSDGQRSLAALYGLIHLTAGQGYALLLDEPDNYVALAEIQPWLMNLSDACGETIPQAILCSHHPELMNYLGRDCGLMLMRETSGVSKARPVEEKEGQGVLMLSELIARGWER